MAQCPAVNPATTDRCTLEVSARHDGKVHSQHEVWKVQGNPPSPKLVQRWSA